MKFINKNWKTSLAILLVLTMFVQIIGPIASDYSYANNGRTVTDSNYGSDDNVVEDVYEEENMENRVGLPNFLASAGKDLGNIFTDVKITVDGKKLLEGESNRIEITHDTEVRLDYNWALADDVGLQVGDWATTTVPNIFKGYPKGASGNLLDENGVSVGTFEFGEGNILKAEFNDELVDKTDRKGTVWFLMKFNEDVINDDSKQDIKFEDMVDKEFQVIIKPGGNTSLISKAGNTDQKINAEYINWTIDVNTSLEQLENATVEDIIPEGLGSAEDIEIYNLKVGAGGSITLEGIFNKTATGFPVELGNIDSAYRIKYKTKIEDFSKSNYNNIAILNDKGVEQDRAEFDIGQLVIGSSIEKSGVANKDGYKSTEITWTIDVNKAEMDLKGVVVKDTPISKELKFKEGSIEIYELNKNGDNWVEGGNVTNDFNPNEFPVTLGNIGTNSYRIKFITDINYDEYRHSNTFENQAILEVEEEEVGDSKAKVLVTRGNLIYKSGKEETSYGDPYIKWIIHVNEAEHSIINAKITDTIPEGLQLDQESIKIYKGHTNEVFDSATIDEKTDNFFKISLGNITDHYRIEYKTNITNPTDNITFTNKVRLEGDGLKGDGIGTDGSIDMEIQVKPSVTNKYTKSTINNKTVDSIKYDGLNHTEKTMSWKITVDAIKEKITKLTITDTFEPEKSMVFLKDSLRVTKNEVLIDSSKYEVEDNKAGGFALEFIGELDRGKYEVYYKTSFNPNMVLDNNGTLNTGRQYTNKAIFTGKTEDVNGKETEEEKLGEDSAKYDINTVVAAGGKKDGVLDRNNRTITWKIYANALGQDLTGSEFKITDTISSSENSTEDLLLGHKFNKESFIVEEYKLKKDGSIAPGNKITEGYEITYSEDGKFTLTFANGIDKPIMVEFKTNIEGISKGKYINKAKITGKDNLNKTYDDDVVYDHHDNFVTKSTSSSDGDKVYTDDQLDWMLKINTSLSEIAKGAVLKDTLSEGLVYVDNSLKIIDSNKNPLTKGEDYTFEKNGNSITITFTNKITEEYTVEYKTVVIAENGKNVTNKASFEGKIDEIGDSSEKTFNVTQTSGGTGSGREKKGSIIIEKINSKGETITAEAEFEIYYMLNGEKRLLGGSTSKTIDGMIKLDNLSLRTYYIKEVSAPNGFVLNEAPIEVKVEKPVGKNNSEIYEIKVENDNKKIDKTGNKHWIGGPEEKPTIELQLYRNGKEYGEPVELKNGDTSYVWENLNLTDNAGNKYTYTVDEVNVPEGYTKTVSSDGLTVINSYEVLRRDITGTKIWEGGPEEKPTIELQLYRNGEEYGDPVALLNGKTSYTWKDLALNDKFGNEYSYTVDEVEVPKDYISNKSIYGKTRSKDGLTVTNTYESPKTDITGRKVWMGGPEEKPSIELQLYRNDEKYGKPVKLENGSFEYVWKGLNQKDNKGVDYKYTVKEVNTPENYEKSEDGLTVTNTYVSPKTEVTGTKKWVGGPEEKPTIELQLYKNGEKYKEPVELKSGIETYTWTDLDLTDENGIDYKYTVKEVNTPENYEKLEDGLTVTNTYVSPKTEVTGTKKWVGGPEEKPTIELQLYRNGEEYGDPVALLNGKTSYTWKDLALNDKFGNEYSYTVDEVEVPKDYINNKSIYGKTRSTDGLTVTNTYESPKTDITGRKVWMGGPEEKPSIELQLYRNDEKYGEPVTLESGSFEYVWKGLNQKDNKGIDYKYTVKEVNTPENYEKLEDGLTVTNTYVSPKTEVTGTKKWVNGPEEKPTIELQLYRNGEKYKEPVEIKNGIETYTWTDLDEFDKSGNKYTYTVDEVNTPENYISEVSEYGLTVTNTYVIPKIEVTGIKEWKGGPRVKPTIELQLYRDGEPYGEPVKLESGEIGYTWENLDKTDIKGKEYIYTIDEVLVPNNYSKRISEDGLTITNKYNPPTKPTDPPGPTTPVGRIRIVKRASDSNDLLKGAEFNIVNSKDRIVDTLVTDSQGKATTRYLPLGKYTIKEVKAPQGYIVDREIIEHRITNGVTQEIVIYNELENPEEPTDPEEPENPEDLEEPSDSEDPDEEEDIDGDTPGDRPDVEPDKPDEETDLDDNVPEDKPSLPVTGSKSAMAFYGIGILSIGLGISLRRKKREDS